MSWRITHPPEYHLNLSGGGSDVNVSRYFITFSSMDGGHAVASSPIALQAGDKVVVESQFKAAPSSSWIWVFDGTTRFAVTSWNTWLSGASTAQTIKDDSNIHTTTVSVTADGDIKTVGARFDGAESFGQIIKSLKVERNGQFIHDFDFNVDSSTDTIVDNAGSDITFNLVNVLPEMRVMYAFEAPNKWVNTNNPSDIIEVIQ